ncbi:MAG: hypothetical protein Q8K78_09215 [Planctomycetaceae bacterium]|nr:hypothetical protein [Planctomycetaceae bacterium]
MTFQLPDPKQPDMSPEAIYERLQMVESLRRLCLSLKEAGDADRARMACEQPPVGELVTAATETPAT